MSVRLTGGFESSDRWKRIAASVHAALREARFGGWDLVIRPRGPEDEARAAGDADDGLGLVIGIDVADMALDVAFPERAVPIEDEEIGRLLVEIITEAEDETENDYGPTDEDDL
ncbi:MAG TPA: hypothetical protein VF796_11795 [Humisphaera sp.]